MKNVNTPQISISTFKLSVINTIIIEISKNKSTYSTKNVLRVIVTSVFNAYVCLTFVPDTIIRDIGISKKYFV